MVAFIKDLMPGLLYLFGLTYITFRSLNGKVDEGLMFVTLLFPLQNVVERLHQFPGGKDIIDIVLIAMVIGWALSKKEKLFVATNLNNILGIMIVFTYICLWHGSFYLGTTMPVRFDDVRLQAWKNYMIFPLLFFLVVNNVRTIEGMKKIFITMLFAIVIMDYYTLNQIRWMSGLASREKLVGTFVWTGVNALAAFYAQYLFPILGLFFFSLKRLHKVLLGILVVVGCYIVLFLYSRGAYAGLLMGLITMSFLRKRIFILPLILFLVFWQSILPITVVERINQTTVEGVGFDTSTEHRLMLWEESFDMFKENPIFGVGFFVVPVRTLGGGFTDTHNIYMKILAEQGLIGIFILASILCKALKNGWILYIKAQNNFLKGLGLGFIACVIATIVTNFFGDRWTYLQVGAFFWVLLGLVVRGNLIVQQEKMLNSSFTTKEAGN